MSVIGDVMDEDDREIKALRARLAAAKTAIVDLASSTPDGVMLTGGAAKALLLTVLAALEEDGAEGPLECSYCGSVLEETPDSVCCNNCHRIAAKPR